MSVDRLQNVLGDYQFDAQKRGFDLDPAEVYRGVFVKIGWDKARASRTARRAASLEVALLREVSISRAIELVAAECGAILMSEG